MLLAEAIAESSTVTLGLAISLAVFGAGFVAAWSSERAKREFADQRLDKLEKTVEAAVEDHEDRINRLERWREREIGAEEARRARRRRPEDDSGENIAATRRIDTPRRRRRED